MKLRFDDFKIVTRDQTLDRYTADAGLIRQTAGQCLKRVPLQRRLRLLGVRVGSLVRTQDQPGAGGISPESSDPSSLDATSSIVTEPQLF